jgi:hypothetical protein
MGFNWAPKGLMEVKMGGEKLRIEEQTKHKKYR